MANGTIAFDTLSTSGQISGTAKSVDTDYVVNGSAKAWHRLGDGTGTIVTRDSFNVSGFTDGGVGLYTVTINNNMSNNLYGVVQGELDWRTTGITDEAAITTADYDMTSRSPATAAALDAVTHTSSVLGDLA